MSNLEEWVKRFEELIKEAEADGVEIETTTCCCGEGLVLSKDNRHIAVL